LGGPWFKVRFQDPYSTVTLDHDRDHDRDHNTRHGNVNTRIAIREDAFQHKFRR
jgi:hypothetical protein